MGDSQTMIRTENKSCDVTVNVVKKLRYPVLGRSGITALNALIQLDSRWNSLKFSHSILRCSLHGLGKYDTEYKTKLELKA